MTPRQSLCLTACGACRLDPESRDGKVGMLASEAAVDLWPDVPVSVSGWERKRLEREQGRIRRQHYSDTKARVVAKIRADPQAYGFTGIELWILGMLISWIVKAIVNWLWNKWQNGGAQQIAAARWGNS